MLSGTVAGDGSLVLKVYYTRNSYNVVLTKGNYITEVSGSGTYEYGQSVTINATIDEKAILN